MEGLRTFPSRSYTLVTSPDGDAIETLMMFSMASACVPGLKKDTGASGFLHSRQEYIPQPQLQIGRILRSSAPNSQASSAKCSPLKSVYPPCTPINPYPGPKPPLPICEKISFSKCGNSNPIAAS